MKAHHPAHHQPVEARHVLSLTRSLPKRWMIDPARVLEKNIILARSSDSSMRAWICTRQHDGRDGSGKSYTYSFGGMYTTQEAVETKS
jgi:hypothetical protein